MNKKKSKLLKSIEKSAKNLDFNLEKDDGLGYEFIMESSMYPGDTFEYINGTCVEKAEYIGYVKNNGVMSLLVGKRLIPKFSNYYVGCEPSISWTFGPDKAIKYKVFLKATYYGTQPDQLESIFPKPKKEYIPVIEDLYLCAKCGLPRTRAEGGTVFTVCDDCWDKKE